MKKGEMNLRVADELKRIPRIRGNLAQNLFRSGYNAVRRHDLAVNPAMPASGSFRRALEQARKTDPSFSPIYDRKFFKM